MSKHTQESTTIKQKRPYHRQQHEGLGEQEQQPREEDNLSFSEQMHLKRYGKPYQRYTKFNSSKRTVVPIEIETSFQLYDIVTSTILEYLDISFEEWVNIYYKQRMKQLLADPKEFGELMLDSVRAMHGLHRMDNWYDD
jgi:hypothetical protein